MNNHALYCHLRLFFFHIVAIKKAWLEGRGSALNVGRLTLDSRELDVALLNVSSKSVNSGKLILATRPARPASGLCAHVLLLSPFAQWLALRSKRRFRTEADLSSYGLQLPVQLRRGGDLRGRLRTQSGALKNAGSARELGPKDLGICGVH